MTAPPEPRDTRQKYEPRGELKRLADVGQWGGPEYEYRGATIRCHPGGHVCGFVLEGHPFSPAGGMGVPGTITPIIDAWLDERQLPGPYKMSEG